MEVSHPSCKRLLLPQRVREAGGHRGAGASVQDTSAVRGVLFVRNGRPGEAKTCRRGQKSGRARVPGGLHFVGRPEASEPRDQDLADGLLGLHFSGIERLRGPPPLRT